MTSKVDATTALMRRRLLIGLVLVLVGAALGLAIMLAAANDPLGIDSWWMARMLEIRTPVLLSLGFAMNWVGGGWFAVFGLPVLIAAWLLLIRRPWGALFFVACELVSAGLVQLLKQSYGRPRPTEMLTASDFGSFPSGHTANAAAIAVALFILFPRAWVAIAGVAWALLMAFSRTLMGAHWLSDTVGGALVGAGASLLVAAALTVPLARERMRLLGRAEGAIAGDATGITTGVEDGISNGGEDLSEGTALPR